MADRNRAFRAMQVADGALDGRAEDGAVREEAPRFAELSGLVRGSLDASLAEPPGFDFLWAGVEQRLDQARREEAVAARAPAREGWLARLLGHRPMLVLAPAGAFLVAVAIGVAMWTKPVATSNVCFVDSAEAETGSVTVDQDFDDAERPTVIWFNEEG